MKFTVSGEVLEVSSLQLIAALTCYDEWLKGQTGRKLESRERMMKVDTIVALIAPRQFEEGGRIVFDYEAPKRLKRVVCSELSKRNKKKTTIEQGDLFSSI